MPPAGQRARGSPRTAPPAHARNTQLPVSWGRASRSDRRVLLQRVLPACRACDQTARSSATPPAMGRSVVVVAATAIVLGTLAGVVVGETLPRRALAQASAQTIGGAHLRASRGPGRSTHAPQARVVVACRGGPAGWRMPGSRPGPAPLVPRATLNSRVLRAGTPGYLATAAASSQEGAVNPAHAGQGAPVCAPGVASGRATTEVQHPTHDCGPASRRARAGGGASAPAVGVRFPRARRRVDAPAPTTRPATPVCPPTRSRACAGQASVAVALVAGWVVGKCERAVQQHGRRRRRRRRRRLGWRQLVAVPHAWAGGAAGAGGDRPADGRAVPSGPRRSGAGPEAASAAAGEQPRRRGAAALAVVPGERPHAGARGEDCEGLRASCSASGPGRVYVRLHRARARRRVASTLQLRASFRPWRRPASWYRPACPRLPGRAPPACTRRNRHQTRATTRHAAAAGVPVEGRSTSSSADRRDGGARASARLFASACRVSCFTTFSRI